MNKISANHLDRIVDVNIVVDSDINKIHSPRLIGVFIIGVRNAAAIKIDRAIEKSML